MLLAAILLPATLSQASVTLKYMPPIGKTIRYSMVMDMQQSMGAATGANMNMKTSVEMAMKALSRSGDVTTVETTMKDGKVTLPPNSPMAGMKAMLEKQFTGKTVTAKMNSHYGIVGNGGSLSSMGGSVGALSGLSFPSHPVKVGDSWSTALDMGKMAPAGAPGGMSMTGKIPIKIKLTSISGGKATMAISMDGTMAMAMGAGAANGQKFTTKMSGKGSMVCNISDGTLVSSSMTSNSTTALGGMTMKQHMVQTMKRL